MILAWASPFNTIDSNNGEYLLGHIVSFVIIISLSMQPVCLPNKLKSFV